MNKTRKMGTLAFFFAILMIIGLIINFFTVRTTTDFWVWLSTSLDSIFVIIFLFFVSFVFFEIADEVECLRKKITPILPKVENVKKKCSLCNKEISLTTKNCPYCGNQVDD